MTTNMEKTEQVRFDDGLDPNASPLDGVDTATTPSTQFSPPESPLPKKAALKNSRLTARQKLQSLSLEEKVDSLEVTCRRQADCPRCPF